MKGSFRSERAFQKWVLVELRKIPRSWWYAPPTRSRRGIPDILGCCNSFFIALELKLDTAKKDPNRELLQEYEISKIKHAQALVAHARVTPSNWLEVRAELIELLDGHNFEEN